ncbi:hypothetical protein CRG98_048244 [Punica granatum]|uniref:Uncharacterized protein n=1 Tax=Punica granatum TaxID=22663 RepID=A0A2I0HJ63_PUNGR|nr:hypothetical protein CRG98_048244 [Punica granatum]
MTFMLIILLQTQNQDPLRSTVLPVILPMTFMLLILQTHGQKVLPILRAIKKPLNNRVPRITVRSSNFSPRVTPRNISLRSHKSHIIIPQTIIIICRNHSRTYRTITCLRTTLLTPTETSNPTQALRRAACHQYRPTILLTMKVLRLLIFLQTKAIPRFLSMALPSLAAEQMGVSHPNLSWLLLQPKHTNTAAITGHRLRKLPRPTRLLDSLLGLKLLMMSLSQWTT